MISKMKPLRIKLPNLVTLNLCWICNQLVTLSTSVKWVLQGISLWMLPLCLGWSALPLKLYNRPDPSGIGKNKLPCKQVMASSDEEGGKPIFLVVEFFGKGIAGSQICSFFNSYLVCSRYWPSQQHTPSKSNSKKYLNVGFFDQRLS